MTKEVERGSLVGKKVLHGRLEGGGEDGREGGCEGGVTCKNSADDIMWAFLSCSDSLDIAM